jgi:hypothetical protein
MPGNSVLIGPGVGTPLDEGAPVEPLTPVGPGDGESLVDGRDEGLPPPARSLPSGPHACQSITTMTTSTRPNSRTENGIFERAACRGERRDMRASYEAFGRRRG